jgi:sec-independent protein translocase protein TatB
MFDIGFMEMAFIGVIALVVIGPERLPGFARSAGLWLGKGRRMLNDAKSDIKKEMSEEDLKEFRDIKAGFSSAKDNVKTMADSASESFGIKEAGEDIKRSIDGAKSDVEEGIETLNDAAVVTTTKKKAAKKKATKKKTGKKTAAKKATSKKTVEKKSTPSKNATTEAPTKKPSNKKTSSKKKSVAKNSRAKKSQTTENPSEANASD